MHGTQMTAMFRQQVADISMKYPTFQQAVASLPQPKNFNEEVIRKILISFLNDEYVKPAKKSKEAAA